MSDRMTELDEWVRGEQANLWYDLTSAIRTSYNGAWSMASAGITYRIISAARLVGPTPWSQVPTSLVVGDLYEAVYELGGVPVTLPNEAEWLRVDELEVRTGAREPTRSWATGAYEATISALRADRQLAADLREDVDTLSP